MIRIILVFLFAFGFGAAQAQTLGDIFKEVAKTVIEEDSQSSDGEQSELSALDVDAGLKQALEVGAELVASRLGQEDGYFKDDVIQIPLPGRLDDLQDGLSQFGLSGPLDDLQLRMNRAAEAAVPQAKTLVVDAIQNLTLEDVYGLLNGGETAATVYLREQTEGDLRQAFRPYVEQSLSQSGALNALTQVAARYGTTGLGDQAQQTLVDHAVQYGLDGLFHYIAEEERAIRTDPVKRTTELLKRVFGS